MCLAVPGQILEAIDLGGTRVGRVRFGGVTRQAFLDFVPEAQVGDFVMVHVGFAISRVDAEEAERAYELLENLGFLQGELGEEAAEATGAPLKAAEATDAPLDGAEPGRIKPATAEPGGKSALGKEEPAS
jgi:hydrogenase expression/formation protein HypC